VQQLLPKRSSQSWEPNRKALAYKHEPWNMSVRLRGCCRLTDNSAFYPSCFMPGESVVTTLTQKRAVFPAREVTSGQMRKIGIHFILCPNFLSAPHQQQTIGRALSGWTQCKSGENTVVCRLIGCYLSETIAQVNAHIGVNHRWRNRGGRMSLDPSTFAFRNLPI